MKHGGDYASANTTEIIGAWSQVSEHARGVSLFRIDSLIWQVAEVIYVRRDEPSAAANDVRGKLVQSGAASQTASEVAAELTWAM